MRAQEFIKEDAGGNYLYHGTDSGSAKKILSSGWFAAKVSGAQNATKSQTQLPVVSFTRSMSYLQDPSGVSRERDDYEVIFVVDRSRLEAKRKTIGTSQTTDLRGLPHSGFDRNTGKPEYGPAKTKLDMEKFKSYDVNKDGQLDSSDADELAKAGTLIYAGSTTPMNRDEVGRELGKYLSLNKAGMFKTRPSVVPQNRFKTGGEYEEVVPVQPNGKDNVGLPIGRLPWRDFVIGFYIQPGTSATKDPELMNHPMRLEMPRPNTFVKASDNTAPAARTPVPSDQRKLNRKAGQELAKQKAIAYKQGVAEGSNDTIYPNAEVIKSKNGRPVGEIYQDGNSWGCFHYRADRGYDMIDTREEAIEALKDLHQETGRSRPDYTIKGVAEAFGPLPRDSQQIRLGRHTVDIERVGLNNDYISFAWHDSQGQEHYEEVAVGDLGSYDDLIKKIKQEISYQERQYTDQGVAENFADGKKPGRKGLAKRVGVDCKQPVSKLRSIASNSSGERQRMAHWCANMKSGKK